MMCVALTASASASAGPSWGVQPQVLLGGWGKGGRMGTGTGMGTSRGVVVRVPTTTKRPVVVDNERAAAMLCPPVRMGRRGTPLDVWCEENGENGEKLLEEWADTEKGPGDVSYASSKKVAWTCVKCGWGWDASLNSRTKSEAPSRCPACAGHVAIETNNLRLTCEERGAELKHLPEEWNHPTKRMEEFTPSSNAKVPWKCGECGCEWEATINSRTKSEAPSRCPGCAGQVATETNNLRLTCEERGAELKHLPEEWNHPTKRMEEFTPSSGEKVPWKCGECGWEWDARISSRTERKRPSRCPECARKKRKESMMRGTPFETWCKLKGEPGMKLLEEFADWRGPMDVTYGSGKKVAWKCVKCGWGWDARIDSRTNSKRPTGCPACAGYVATETNNLRLTCEESGERLKHLPEEWNHPTKRMEEFTPSSNAKVPWKCVKCGWGWDASPANRTNSKGPTGCPACAGHVATETNNLRLTCEERGAELKHLPEEWNHPTKRMEEFTPSSGEKVPWKCGECGWGWDATIYNRTKSKGPTGCPKCN